MGSESVRLTRLRTEKNTTLNPKPHFKGSFKGSIGFPLRVLWGGPKRAPFRKLESFTRSLGLQ